MNAADWKIISAADQLAVVYHKDQVRKFYPEPYYNHVERVADTIQRGEYRDDPVVIAAAYLHDILEDTDCTGDEIANACGDEVLNVVQRLTRTGMETYKQYLHRVCTDPRSWVIKRADVADNISTLPATHSKLIDRYLNAANTLFCNAPVATLPLREER